MPSIEPVACNHQDHRFDVCHCVVDGARRIDVFIFCGSHSFRGDVGGAMVDRRWKAAPGRFGGTQHAFAGRAGPDTGLTRTRS
jgi:hypothetical protein